MSDNTCPQCGAGLPAGDEPAVCPRCALNFGMGSNPGDSEDAFSGAGNREALTESFQGGMRSAKKQKSPEELPQPGDRFGSYQLTRILGRGGMGMVYEAEDMATSRRVALKLLTHGWDSPEARNRFFREGRLAASINHPHSVYIYGTEEIEGTPAISMEHIAGGTLQDRVRQDGPFAPAVAVDAILDIIAGLEAAASVGVLHRDVKPSNCFIDAEGTVKIGDFGLSISTTAHSDSFLTVPGAFLGTPAFSSPEQLRGDVLDVRSDIYAVGVTLFYLLTGRTPFEGDNLVKLLATVLEQPAPSPAQFSDRLPPGLCKVVLRCLAKQPGDRFRDYGQLRAALTPFDSTAPTTAALAKRLAAGGCDFFVFSMTASTVYAALWGVFHWTSTGAQLFGIGFSIALNLAYYAVPEALWGASLGKALMGLRVTFGQQGRLGFGRAMARTLIYVGLPGFINWIYWGLRGTAEVPLETPVQVTGMVLLSVSHWGILAALFSTMRRSNGFAAVHDLATGARVVAVRRRAQRPALDVAADALPDRIPGEKVGPYHILDSLRKTDGDELLLGYDPRLLRRVWIHRRPPGVQPVSNQRRGVGRVGRLRWISGHDTGDASWDAFDSFGGSSFLDLAAQPQPWEAVRIWLLDLANELQAAGQDGTLPAELRLENLWITGDGRAKLLDFAAPASDHGELATVSELPATSSADPGRFLQRVALLALQGGDRPDGEEACYPVLRGIPVSAAAAVASFDKMDLPALLPELGVLSTSTARITRRHTLGVYAALGILPLLAASVTLSAFLGLRTMADIRPELDDLRITMVSRNSTASTGSKDLSEAEQAKLDKAWEVYVANRFRDTIQNKKTWNELLAQTIPFKDREFAEHAVSSRPNPSDEEIDEAEALVDPLVQPTREMYAELAEVTGRASSLATMAILQFTLTWAMLISLPALIAALLVRRGVIARAFGIEYTSRRGVKASKPRLLWRAMLAQSPIAINVALLIFWMSQPSFLSAGFSAILAVLAMCLLAPWKSRSVVDRLAGTYPVPV